MKLTNIEEVNGFLAAVDKCNRAVYLTSPEGDHLNLKSTLSRYISIGRLLSADGDKLELFCDDFSDAQNFFRFFGDHPSVTQ